MKITERLPLGTLPFKGWVRSAGIGLLVALLSIGAAHTNLFATFELKTLDARFQLRGSRNTTAPLAVVFIGDDSIEALGRWRGPGKITRCW